METSVSTRLGAGTFHIVGAEAGRSGILPGLAGVSETMLWSLHNRACEAKRSDGILPDPESLRIRDAIDYDFEGRFGEPEGSLAARAAGIDRVIRQWLRRYPDGCIVSLGEGLETQVRRVDNGRMHWLSVDLPDAIRLREYFMPSTERFRHLALSALDPAWMEAVDPSAGVFLVAQGLLMYLEPTAVQALFIRFADRFPGAEMAFDAVPPWFSALTMRGLMKTPHYRLPTMPWGIRRDEIEPTLRAWHPRVGDITLLDYAIPRGLPRTMASLIQEIPFMRHEVPSLVHATIAPGPLPAYSMPSFAPIPISSGGSQMPTQDPMSETHSIAGLLAAINRNTARTGDVATATRHVFGKRVAMGMAAALNPLRADHDEFAQIIPEKVEAFSSAGMIMLKHSTLASRQMTRLASDEMATASRAMSVLAGCSSPADLVKAQHGLTAAWFERAASSFLAWGMLALDAQDAALAPIRQTVVANAERLRP